jgi:hypothetical protein
LKKRTSEAQASVLKTDLFEQALKTENIPNRSYKGVDQSRNKRGKISAYVSPL